MISAGTALLLHRSWLRDLAGIAVAVCGGSRAARHSKSGVPVSYNLYRLSFYSNLR